MTAQQIGTFEAKTNFSQIIQKVENGAVFIITKRGKPVAKIIPFEEQPKMTFHEAIQGLFEMSKHFKGDPKTFNFKEAREWGRK